MAPGEVLLFHNADGQTRVQVRLEDGTVWLTQKLMAELFQTSVPNINQHLAAVYEEAERPMRMEDWIGSSGPPLRSWIAMAAV